jgi:hypothetical protein
MRFAGSMSVLMAAGLLCEPVIAQQTPSPSPAFAAEREAANAALLKAEKLLNDGQRGPDTETCSLMASYFLHVVKAAVAAGAKARVADWPELTSEEQIAVIAKVDGHYDRNKKLRAVACARQS